MLLEVITNNKIADARRSCVRIVGSRCDVAGDGQTESARPRARAYEYPVIGSIQQSPSSMTIETAVAGRRATACDDAAYLGS